MKKIMTGILLCSFVFGVSGCKSDSTQSGIDKNAEETSVLNKGDYAALLPYEASNARIKHSSTSTDLSDAFTIGTGLMDLSKEHFSASSYAYKEGQFLTYSVLDAVSDGTGLLGRTSETNPNGMNPQVGAEFTTDNGKKKITASDVLLMDIHEIDWYKSKELGGISLAVVLNSEIGDNVNPDTIDDVMLKAYGEDVGRKIVSYLRKTHPEISQKLPIYVTLYKESGVNTTLPGTFIGHAYFESKTVGEYASISEAWALFPSVVASKLDGTNGTYFDRFVSSIKKLFPEDTAVIGKGHFRDGKLKTLNIDISMHAKTWPEASAMIQKIKSGLSVFNSTSFNIKVSVKSDEVLVAAMSRDEGSSSVTAIALVE